MEIYNNFDLLSEDLQGWNGTSEIFKSLIAETKPTVIVEVGSWKGQSTVTMGKAIKDMNLSTKIYCVDTWLGAIEFLTTMKDTPERNLLTKYGYPQVYYQFLSNIIHNKLQDIVLPIPNTSAVGYKYLKYFKVEPQLIYIDASHEEEDVYLDIKNYYELLQTGGTIFGDDYRNWTGVSAAVRRFTSEINCTYDVVENNFWVIKK